MILKMYEEFKSNQEIESICAQYGIENYTINQDGSVDIQGDVGGNFICSYIDNLTTLDGLEDTIIGGDMFFKYCHNLYSLDGFPIDFKGTVHIEYTPIETIYLLFIKRAYIKGTNQLAQAIQFFNQLQVIEEGSFGWEISYRKLLEYLKRYKEFGRPTKEEIQKLVGDKYIVR